jgi:hypothetical protein
VLELRAAAAAAATTTHPRRRNRPTIFHVQSSTVCIRAEEQRCRGAAVAISQHTSPLLRAVRSYPEAACISAYLPWHRIGRMHSHINKPRRRRALRIRLCLASRLQELEKTACRVADERGHGAPSFSSRGFTSPLMAQGHEHDEGISTSLSKLTIQRFVFICLGGSQIEFVSRSGSVCLD